MTSLSPTQLNHSLPDAAPRNPWGQATTASQSVAAPRSPTIQEILDEELARQLYNAQLQEAATLYSQDDSVPSDALEEVQDSDDDEYVEHVEDAEPDFDGYDDADEYDDAYLSKTHRMRGGSGRRNRDVDMGPSNIRLTGAFDERTRFVLSKLAGRGILEAVNSKLHSSLTSQIHIGSKTRVMDGSDEPVQTNYAVKILKEVPSDRPQTTTESVKHSGRRMDEEMLWMSMRRQLKIRMDREHAALARAVACGVRAPMPVCSWEHVMVTSFVGDQTKAAQCLRDVRLSSGQLAQAFVDLLVAVRAMYQQAKLVHGGLSEFSVLYHNDACWITDFSTSIDTAHEEHSDALDKDITFLCEFFAQHGMPKATKHNIGLLNASAIHELVTEEAPSKILSAFPWIKPYLYYKKK